MSGGGGHALLSPSSAERWLACPPSARLCESLPEEPSAYAEEGSLAHAFAALALRRRYGGMGAEEARREAEALRGSPLYSPEMPGHAEEYASYADLMVGMAMAGGAGRPHVAIERRFDLSAYAPESFGTADCAVVGGGLLQVADYKYGKGVPVAAERNAQMMCYALGALLEYGALYSIGKVRLCVVQPRLASLSEWETGADELLGWGASVLRPGAALAFEGKGAFAAGAHCRFCRAKALCRARAGSYMSLEPDKGRLPPLITDAEAGGLITRGRGLAAWLADLEEAALQALLAGREVPGWKAVEGRSVRALDADAAFPRLVEAGTDEALLYKRVPITLTEAERLLGRKAAGELLAPYVTKPPGKPTLAEASDRRPAIASRQTALEDFGGG